MTIAERVNQVWLRARRALFPSAQVDVPALIAERDRLNHLVHHQRQLEQAAPQRFPPGHFYSPIPPREEIERDAARIFAALPGYISGVDLREAGQLKILRELRPYYDAMSFPEQRTSERRYWYENPAYSYSDSFFLHAMIRHLGPKNVIEIGSGYSSAMLLDTNELHFDNAIACTFIEPYPELLLSLLHERDRERVTVIATRLQEVPLETFDALRENDILFVDSTHVVRAGSDVNYIFFSILPRLRPGVYIHFHDVFYPFEYPRPWIEEGRQWHELYLLRAFLMYNTAFEIVVMNTFLQHFHRDEMKRDFGLLFKNEGGSIWLRKIA